MKPVLLQATTFPQRSFLVKKDVGEKMLNEWHYHPEIELLLMKKSSGTWLIGDHIGHFQNGDVVLIGPNLPHSFRYEWQENGGDACASDEAICVKFCPDILGPQFFAIPETRQIASLLTRCQCGLQLTGKTRESIARALPHMLTTSPGNRLIGLLAMLEEIAESREYVQLSSKGFAPSPDHVDNGRIRRIFEFTFARYAGKITLAQVAGLINMTRQSFCRYFKHKTGKTYIQFLMEVRIGHACRLLVEDEKNVAEICYSCGYNNISNFNQQFKWITGKKPLEYKRDYLQMGGRYEPVVDMTA